MLQIKGLKNIGKIIICFEFFEIADTGVKTVHQPPNMGRKILWSQVVYLSIRYY